MTMENLLELFILIPLLGCFISWLIPSNNEQAISIVAYWTSLIQLLLAAGFTLFWILDRSATLHAKEWVLYRTAGYEFYIDLMFDSITAVYLLMGAFLSFLISIYSRYYLHRESGYKRFFNHILLFFFGYNLIVFAGNMETLFIGWEVLGLASFLLIAFYRDRYLPVKNALKVFSIYRIGDVGLILAMWMSHHLWHENISFIKLSQYELVHHQLQQHSAIGIFISLMILVAAAAKSAQFPFTSWLPRAMEGPTPSTAIFYGALSVHMGVFLLLRTHPFWEHQVSIRFLIAILGLATTLLATGSARVQSSIKSQIAYASTAQIGLIFIEVSLGFTTLALIHFAGNAFLRSYQLLVSPSIVSYLIREQFYHFVPHKKTIEHYFPEKVRNTLYVWSLKEWNVDFYLREWLWSPLKKVGDQLNGLTISTVLWGSILLWGVALILYHFEAALPSTIKTILPELIGFTGLILVLKSFTERKNTVLSWLLVSMNHMWVALAVTVNSHFYLDHILLYLSGVLLCGGLGLAALAYLGKQERNISLTQFHGHSYEHPRLAAVFLICSLGLIGFPITPTFIGEDLVFSHIEEDQALLAIFIAVSFIVDSLAVMRIYSRVFLGPHSKTYHEVAHRSA
jgi:NADH-quinone oxidoreductase subunit L